jgi:predicted glutamine amidotransferase
MCRILFLSGKIEHPEIFATLKKFQRLAEYGKIPKYSKRGHKDGWGIVACAKSRPFLFIRSDKDAFADPKYMETVKSLENKKADIIICHLRKAFVGGKNIQNSQPFVWKNFSFCHNGTVLEGEKIPLNAKFKSIVKGETDSEKLFAFILQHLRGDRNDDATAIRKAIKKAVRDIRNNFDFTAMNIIFSDGKYSWALREVNEKNEEVKKKKLMGYYSLFIGLGKNYKIICSEKLSLKNIKWRALKNHELLQISGKHCV